MSQLNVTSLKHEGASGDNITLSSNGNVGIGTSFPSQQLHVNGVDNKILIESSNYAALQLKSGSVRTFNLQSVNDGSGALRIYDVTANTERLRIDSAGRVTMPYQPVVSATRNSDFGSNGAAQALINFEGVQVNVGNHYNSATGIFTCPVSGTYRITAFGMLRVSTSSGVFNYNAATARHNGSQIGGAAYNWGDGYVHISGNWMINASTGDALSVYMSSCLGGYGGLTIELIG
jgi:hypothetical protein